MRLQSVSVAGGGARHLRTGAAVVTVSPRVVGVPAHQRAEAVGVVVQTKENRTTRLGFQFDLLAQYMIFVLNSAQTAHTSTTTAKLWPALLFNQGLL